MKLSAIVIGLVVPVLLCHSRTSFAEAVDVYFVAGQSNASNFMSQAGLGDDDLGFTLHTGRTPNPFVPPYPAGSVVNGFSSSSANGSLAVSVLASELHQDGADVAVYGFARNGTPVAFEEGHPNWFPGTDPASGEVYNDSMYANFVEWANQRLADLTDAGHTPRVAGLFWFQGERDAVIGTHEDYETNLTNLIYRFREDFGDDLPIVAAEIREVGDTSDRRAMINDALASIADDDPLFSLVPTADYPFRSPTDVHLTNAGHALLAADWAEAMLVTNAFNLGDLNGDSYIGIEDLDIILANWGAEGTPGNAAPGDLNGDGMTNNTDLQIFLANWGSGDPPQGGIVPEPASALSLGGMLLLCMRRGVR